MDITNRIYRNPRHAKCFTCKNQNHIWEDRWGRWVTAYCPFCGSFETNEYKPHIPKSELEHGGVYVGECRNASLAIWLEPRNCFIYYRLKFNSLYLEDINHPEDDNGYDLFWPYTMFKFGENAKHDADYEVLSNMIDDFGTKWNEQMAKFGAEKGTLEDLKSI